ncbi:SRPBCC domain-containing protein [Psychrobacillus glaciei]|uniref:SRPBCC domain-containing protein n=1 Tax=Psychrobacillus glaciei TaxID=2283160 RepID=A0A5J6SMH6_9BACI|nr:SRPBCC domain-containing protein [Psychrobacillus glaciei]QFF99141.1 SRPBCC domain-containing protein [Psychrobacillus glaciei]
MKDLSLDFQFTSSINKVWESLTDSEVLAKWMWKNDFKPVVGHVFQFRAEPNEWWDGILNGEVLEVDEPHKLSYKLGTGSEIHTVTWTFTKSEDGGTHLHLDQTGISDNPGAFEGAKYGQTESIGKLKKLLGEL